MRKIDLLFVWLGVFFVLFFMIVERPLGEELSEISPRNAAYCALFAREAVFVDMMHGPAPSADADYILDRAKQHYADCLAVLPTLLPLPDEGSLKQWLADIRDLLALRVANAGTVPATAGEEEWLAQCARNYSTWDEDTGTVVRRGSPERVRCPCGGEVVCE